MDYKVKGDLCCFCVGDLMNNIAKQILSQQRLLHMLNSLGSVHTVRSATAI